MSDGPPNYMRSFESVLMNATSAIPSRFISPTAQANGLICPAPTEIGPSKSSPGGHVEIAGAGEMIVISMNTATPLNHAGRRSRLPVRRSSDRGIAVSRQADADRLRMSVYRWLMVILRGWGLQDSGVFQRRH